MRQLCCCLVLLCGGLVASAQQAWNPLGVDITRYLVKDLFESNAVTYVQPMITTINATSNARFYSQAYVPSSVDAPYFRVGVHGMVGFVRDDMRSYTPTLDLGAPSTNLVADVTKYGTIDIINRRFVINNNYQDTLGLATLLLREMLIEARKQGKFPLPPSAATLFGNQPDVRVMLPPTDTLLAVLRNRADYKAIVGLAGQGVDSALAGLLDSLTLPSSLTLPPGADMSTLIAAVPQFEIGSLWGTELLIRFVPPVELDTNVGKFAFWGVGLKHSISQYFPERWFDAAVQIVYQGTDLTNSVGFTESKLDAHATIWSGNIHVSKRFFDVVDIFSGLSYDKIDVRTTYTYVLPQEVQIALGLLPTPPPGQKAEPTPEQPGDTRPQTSIVYVGDTNMKWTIGAAAQLGPIRIVADYNVGRFNIFSGGLEVTF